MPTHTPIARLDAPRRPSPPRFAGQRRPFVPSLPSGPYRLPPAILDRLQRDLASFRNRDAAMALALFLARYWSAPRRVALAFPADRRALAKHPALDLSEDRVRGALATLERVCFITREVAAPGRRYQRTNDGLRRRPILFRFGLDVMPDLLAANTRSKSARQRPAALSGGVPHLARRLGAFSPPCPSVPFPRASLKPAISPIRNSYRIALPLGEQPSKFLAGPPPSVPIPLATDVSAAIERIRAARARALKGGW